VETWAKGGLEYAFCEPAEKSLLRGSSKILHPRKERKKSGEKTLNKDRWTSDLDRLERKKGKLFDEGEHLERAVGEKEVRDSLKESGVRKATERCRGRERNF